MPGTVRTTLWLPDLKLKWWLAMREAEKGHTNPNNCHESSTKFVSLDACLGLRLVK